MRKSTGGLTPLLEASAVIVGAVAFLFALVLMGTLLWTAVAGQG